jgi:hypothetical protein
MSRTTSAASTASTARAKFLELLANEVEVARNIQSLVSFQVINTGQAEPLRARLRDDLLEHFKTLPTRGESPSTSLALYYGRKFLETVGDASCLKTAIDGELDAEIVAAGTRVRERRNGHNV